MPRVMVIADESEQQHTQVLLDERVESVHLSDEHSAMQLVERLGWAISDAEDAERAPATLGVREGPDPCVGGRTDRNTRSPE
jgi:hypothetical protein